MITIGIGIANFLSIISMANHVGHLSYVGKKAGSPIISTKR
jgi:hypothetical protein